MVAALLPGYPTIVSNFTVQRPRTAGDKLKDKAPAATCWQSQSQLYKSVEPAVGTSESCRLDRAWTGAELTDTVRRAAQGLEQVTRLNKDIKHTTLD